jgi:hypothetical protein
MFTATVVVDDGWRNEDTRAVEPAIGNLLVLRNGLHMLSAGQVYVYSSATRLIRMKSRRFAALEGAFSRGWINTVTTMIHPSDSFAIGIWWTRPI